MFFLCFTILQLVVRSNTTRGCDETLKVRAKAKPLLLQTDKGSTTVSPHSTVVTYPGFANLQCGNLLINMLF